MELTTWVWFWIATAIYSIFNLVIIHKYIKELRSNEKTIKNMFKKQEIDSYVISWMWEVIESQEKEIEAFKKEIKRIEWIKEYAQWKVTELKVKLSLVTWEKKFLKWRKFKN
jgi:hypothetical protein